MNLNIVWFLLIAVLIAGYAILDGFDLGVGAWSLFAKSDEEKRLHMNAIGPVWDGNEVWLLTGGGALFAAFPIVYATVFSGFYRALVLVLLALILRATSFEFRSKVESPAWRKTWDWAFGLGSLLPAVLFGVAVGNVLRGVPIAQDGSYQGTFWMLLNPFALVVGLLSLALFLTHGAIYMTMKVEGPLAERMRAYASRSWMAGVVLWVIATLYAWLDSPHLFASSAKSPLTYVLLALFLAATASLPVLVKAGRFGLAFVASSGAIVTTIALAAVALFPRLVPSSLDLAFSLDIYNAASTPRTLATMLVIALIGVPIVLAYTIAIYRVFRGKVTLVPESY